MQPTKWDSKVKRTRKRLDMRKKLAYLERYESEKKRGRDREKIIAKFAKEIGVTSQRQVERILAQAKQCKQHYTELSKTALILASSFESYLDNFRDTIGDAAPYRTVRDAVCSRWFPYEFEKSDLNLLYHLKEEFLELANISDWGDLTTDNISDDFIARLTLKANRGDFMGKCPACQDY